MPIISLPFSEQIDGEAKGNRVSAELYQQLSEPFKKACENNSHLADYVGMCSVAEIEIPEFVTDLKRSDGDRETKNLIYPVSDNMFVHIFSSAANDRDVYIPIEPGMTEDLSQVMLSVENRLLDIAGDLEEAETDEERTEGILKCLKKVCSVSRNGSRPNLANGKPDSGSGKVSVSTTQYEALKYLIIRDKIGMGVMEPLIVDPNIEDISCSGIGPIFVEHKIFKSLASAIVFEAHEELDDFVLRLSEHIKKPVTLRKPIVDATLPDGSRINIVFGREISRRGSNFTIRKFAGVPLSIMELIGFGSINYEMAAYLSLILEDGMNVFVVGETASGKTTLLNAITTFIPINNKIVSIEDTPELQVPHSNWLREVANASGGDEKEAKVSMFELLKAALRQRPNVIIIGEIRGEEGNIAFGAMQTGHAVMSTFHAASVEKVIQRITGHPINVPKTHVDNLNVVVVQNAVKLPNGKNGRRACSISEIVSYDPPSESFNYVEVFRWDPATDEFNFVGSRNSYLLEDRIAIRRGIPADRKWEIYALLDRRARILERLHKDRGVTNFYELLNVLAKAQEQKLF
ncbi:MAG: type II/IV secretion system ATPase subunit [Dehalococcoidales bacterium]|nr:MAG: type II/IV secretion system ATPase subunit [Dehalococcoidales bacterium]